jgi:hypothetical protein
MTGVICPAHYYLYCGQLISPADNRPCTGEYSTSIIIIIGVCEGRRKRRPPQVVYFRSSQPDCNRPILTKVVGVQYVESHWGQSQQDNGKGKYSNEDLNERKASVM